MLEEIFRKLEWERKGVNIGGCYLSNLRFADDSFNKYKKRGPEGNGDRARKGKLKRQIRNEYMEDKNYEYQRGG